MSEQQRTDVADDAQATAAELLERAHIDYANGWGQPDVRADASNEAGGAS